MMILLTIIIFLNITFMQCEYEIGDTNNDQTLDILDVISFVDIILNNNSNDIIEIYEIKEVKRTLG